MIKLAKKYWYLFLLAVIIASGVGVKSQVKDNRESFYTIKKQTLKESLSLSGEIDAEEEVNLRFQTSGKLVWVGVKTGDYVKKYQAIASLDQREVKKELEKELNDFLKYRWDYDQKKEDYKDKAMTDAMRRILDKAQYDLNNSIADVEIQNLAVELSTLITPIEGIVTNIGSPYPGVNVTASQAEFTVINPKTIYFSVSAEQTDVTELKEGMKGEIILDSYPDKVIKGKVTNISFNPSSTDSTTTYEVKMSLMDNNNDFKYRIGMTGDVDFVLREKRNVLSIPTSKVEAEGNKKYIYKLENNKKIKTYLKLGQEVDGNAEVLSGLKEGDIVVNWK